MLLDFHTHTTASDGELAPSELIDRALARGIRLFAITDHDTVSGYRAAREYYTRIGGEMTLVSGIEFSCRWSGLTVHILGLGFDSDHSAVVQGVAQLSQARLARGEAIAQRLAGRGFPGAFAGASLEAGDSQLGRPHFAAWLKQQGYVASINAAFDKYLGQGKIGDVKAFWPELEEVTQWCVAAGGTAVIAHPLKYKLTYSKLSRLVRDFQLAGGTAVELLSGRQTAAQSRQLQRLAEEHSLAISAGSDFHRDTLYGAELGVESPSIEGLQGVWQRWQGANDLVAESSQ